MKVFQLLRASLRKILEVPLAGSSQLARERIEAEGRLARGEEPIPPPALEPLALEPNGAPPGRTSG